MAPHIQPPIRIHTCLAEGTALLMSSQMIWKTAQMMPPPTKARAPMVSANITFDEAITAS